MTPNPRPPPLSAKQPPYPHIQDLVARTNPFVDSRSSSIGSWIEKAKLHWHQAKWYRDMGRLDVAYVDYLTAFTVVANIVPKSYEYPTFRSQDSALSKDYLELRETLDAHISEFEKIKEAIRMDNEASGVVSTVDHLAGQSATINGAVAKHKNAERTTRPEIPGKPEYLSSRASASQPGMGNGSATDLEARFQRLSMNKNASRPFSTPSNGLPASLVAGGPATTHPSPKPSNGLPTSLVTGGTASTRPPLKPQGPREMVPPLAQLDMKAALPQIPAPIYSPSASYGSPRGLSPPRSSTRTSVNSAKQNEVRRASLPGPAQQTLTVEMLANYLKAVSVLLLDVRSRDEYEEGHIYFRNIVCIEPIILREGMSGEQLEEALVLAPENEYQLFKRRDNFDLVVYYDQSTSDASYLESGTGDRYLRHLHLALDDFSYSRPTRRPPLLLSGGLDAWIDIYGLQSLLITDSLAAAPASPRPEFRSHRSSRDVNRAPTPLVLERRPATEHAPPYPLSPGPHKSVQLDMPMPSEPINIEEEQKWLDRLHKESEPVTITVPETDSTDGKQRRRKTSIVSKSNADPYMRTVEDFFKQYPASPLMQESMTLPETPLIPRRTHNIIDHPFHVFTDVRNPEFHPPPSPVRPPPVAPRKSYSGVSERLTPAVPSIPERPPKTPLLPQTPGSGNTSIGTTGLKNLGNTCYMNSILQCMSGTIPLSRYFLDGSYKMHINRSNPLGSRGVLAEAFANVVRNLWSGEYKFISPVTFKDVSGRLNETFRSDDQQDAQEFLAFLLDGLHEDLNPNATRQKLNPLSDEEERRREKLPVQVVSHIEWQRYVHNNSSVAVNWLQGQLSSKLKCLTCGITSTTYNPFMYLSLPIPIVNGQFTLRDCLAEFTKEETLDGDDAWHCPNCKQPRRATKRLTITRLPHILILHLKRFTNRGRWRDKLNTHIGLPLSDLDLTGYVPPPLPVKNGNSRSEPSPETTPPFIYDLYGIVNHYGTLHGGHYTAFVKNPYKGSWNTFDDSKATNMPEPKVVSRNAYVLFWVRKHVM